MVEGAASAGIRIQKVSNTLKENGQDYWATRLHNAYYAGTGPEVFEGTVNVLNELAGTHIAAALGIDDEARGIAAVLSLGIKPDPNAIPTGRALPTSGASSLLAALRDSR